VNREEAVQVRAHVDAEPVLVRAVEVPALGHREDVAVRVGQTVRDGRRLVGRLQQALAVLHFVDDPAERLQAAQVVGKFAVRVVLRVLLVLEPDLHALRVKRV